MRYQVYKNLDNSLLSDPKVPVAARLGMPELLFDRFERDFGKSQARRLPLPHLHRPRLMQRGDFARREAEFLEHRIGVLAGLRRRRGKA